MKGIKDRLLVGIPIESSFGLWLHNNEISLQIHKADLEGYLKETSLLG